MYNLAQSLRSMSRSQLARTVEKNKTKMIFEISFRY